MTLMFAGHDTSTSTLTFMMHELARHPDVLAKLCAGAGPGARRRGADIDKLEREMPYLDMVLDEVLRLYPPAWIGPRRAVRDFEFGGYSVARGAYVNYCSWASHRLPEVFPEPEAFIPERFTRERKAALPRGAYVPFGGGRRICIGKRFGQIEVKLVATMLLQRLRLDAMPGRTMTVRQMPTLSPRGGLRDAGAAAPSSLRRGCGRWSSPTPTSAPGPGATCCARSSSSSGWRPQLEGIDELILLGDLFDFLFGSVGDAVDAADGLLAPDRREADGQAARLPRRQPRPPPRPPRRREPARGAAGRGRPAAPTAADPRPPGPSFFQRFLDARLPGRRDRDRLPDLQLRRRALHPRPLPRPARAAAPARAATAC